MPGNDIIIIGGGVSGLSLAHYCAKAGLRTTLLEKNTAAGGAMESHAFTEASPDFWVEMGAHTCYNSYGNLIDILTDDSALSRLRSREKVPFKILVGNEVKSIPSQLNFLSVIPRIPRLFTAKKVGKSIEDYYSALVGRSNYEKVLVHAFNAVVSQPAGSFPADVLFKKRPRRQDVLKKFTFDHGVQTIAEVIAGEKSFGLITGAEVKAVDIGDRTFSVVTGGNVFEADKLALAVPASVAAELLQTGFPEISRLLSQIKVSKVESVGAAVKKTAVSIEPFANMFAVDDLFYSVVSRDVLPHPEWRGFAFHFKPGAADMETKLQRMAEVLGTSPAELTHIYSKDNYVPGLKVGHEKLIEEIDRLSADKNLFLTGNYFGGLAIEDCVSRSLAEFKRLSTKGT